MCFNANEVDAQGDMFAAPAAGTEWQPIYLAKAFRHLPRGRANNTVALTPEVSNLLSSNCVVAIGVSGGKDSDACAIAVSRYLDSIGHAGPRVLIHSNLGRIEWRESLPSCERLAARLGWELMVVRREAGDMLARWQGRWANNLARYRDLECVRLILPWSTPSMRFCTSELKNAVISSALRKRFPAHDILNVTGIRRQESTNRSRMPVSAPQPKLARKGYAGVTWNAIIEWPVEDVLETIKSAGLDLHEAYATYGSSRVSCVACIMSSISDLNAAVSCPDNHAVYRQLVELEAASSYAFQGSRWLADVAPELLSEDLRRRVMEAKQKATERQAIEAELPKHLLYTAGWPTEMPSTEEAELIASVRRRIAALIGIEARYLTADEVLARYAELLVEKVISQSKKLSAGATGGSKVREIEVLPY